MEFTKPRVVIIGGGFAGLNAARVLGRQKFPVTLIDRNNYHLFQPLLYQVATGFLAPGDIAAPLRSVVSRYESVRVLQDEVVDVDPAEKSVIAKNGTYQFDYLIVATGVTHSYFGNDSWSSSAPGLKTIENATDIRSRVLRAFEDAERCNDAVIRAKILSLAVVGGGPTGVELAGALAELSRNTLKKEFRNFDTKDVRISLIEGGPRILAAFHEKSSRYAERTLTKLGVTVQTGTKVTNVGTDTIEVEVGGKRQTMDARIVLWAAGVAASPLAEAIAKRTGASRDRSGRIVVSPDLSIPNHPNIFVLGDLAAAPGKEGQTLPGLAPVAIQQGGYLGNLIVRKAEGKTEKPFAYFDKGTMAVIGRGRAVAESWKFRLTGFPAWIAWALIHIYYLIEFENKFVVFFHWAWNYITNKRGSLLITKS